MAIAPRRPRAALVCVGSELLAGQVNTHQAWLSVRLREVGFEVVSEESVPDQVEAIAEAMRRATKRAEAVLVCGGLGPTFDDLTREAACVAARRTMKFRPALWADILRRYARYHAKVPEENKRQAMAIAGAEILDNPVGSAPGQFLKLGRRSMALMPGPPAEMYPMFRDFVLPRLSRRHARGVHVASYSVRLSGVPESVADERLDPVRTKWQKGRFTILASEGEVSFHVTLPAGSAAQAARIRFELRRDVRAAVRPFIHGEGEETLEAALGKILRRSGRTLATAESCTGGLISGRLTAIPGSSDYYRGGLVCYANGAKTVLAGVSPAILRRYGAVSAECATAMAAGARRALGASIGIAVTGIAGPGGGTREKPVGLVYVAVSGPGRTSAVKRLSISGARASVRSRATTAALRLAFDAADGRIP